jgi:16S rRNA G966 N2-methylase RsmD
MIINKVINNKRMVEKTRNGKTIKNGKSFKKSKSLKKSGNIKHTKKGIKSLRTPIKIKPTSQIRSVYTSRLVNNIKDDNRQLTLNINYIQNTKYMDLNDLLAITNVKKLNTMYYYQNEPVINDVLVNPYEYITFNNINKKYYLDTYVAYDKVKFLAKKPFTINNKLFIPLTKYTSHNIYDKKYTLNETLIANNLIQNNKKTYLSLDMYGPYEIIDKTLYLYSDLQSSIDNIHKGNKYISIYDYESWGMDISYDNIVHESMQNNNIDFSYLIQKIVKFSDTDKIIKYVLKSNNYKMVDFIYMRNLNPITGDKCIQEYNFINYISRYLNVIFQTLVNNGTFVISLNRVATLIAFQDLLFYLSTFFNEVVFYNNKVKPSEINFIFKKFNRSKISDNVLSNIKLHTELIIEHFNNGIDGNKLKFNIYNNKLECKEKNTDKQNNIIIKSILNLDNHTIEKLNNTTEYDKTQQLYIRQYSYFKKWLLGVFNSYTTRLSIIQQNYKLVNNISSSKYNEFIDLILVSNLNYAIEYCKEYKLDINPYYLTENNDIRNDIITNNEFILQYFPNENGIKYTDLMITRIGLYSISPDYVTEFIFNKINKHFIGLDNYILTEANGGIGGDSILFTKYFKYVNIVELDKLHSNIINNNLKVYKRKNFKVYNNDYTLLYNKLKQDIVYFDPPWGGVNYHSKKTVDLYLSAINIIDIIIDLLKNKTKIILKCPYNYNVLSLKNAIKHYNKDIYTYQLRSVMLIFIL